MRGPHVHQFRSRNIDQANRDLGYDFGLVWQQALQALHYERRAKRWRGTDALP